MLTHLHQILWRGSGCRKCPVGCYMTSCFQRPFLGLVLRQRMDGWMKYVRIYVKERWRSVLGKGLDGSLAFSVGLDSAIDVLKKIVPSAGRKKELELTKGRGKLLRTMLKSQVQREEALCSREHGPRKHSRMSQYDEKTEAWIWHIDMLLFCLDLYLSCAA